MQRRDLAPILIYSPTTSPERMRYIDSFAAGFIYCVARKGVTGENLLRLLEMRLDNVVYSLGFATSRSQAKIVAVADRSCPSESFHSTMTRPIMTT